VLFETLHERALPRSLDGDDEDVAELARVYKAITAPVGPLGLTSLSISTKALASGDATSDAKYTAGEAFLADLTTKRDALVDKIKPALDAAEFHHTPIDRHLARVWAEQGEELLELVKAFDAAF
jgi:hypothetical protein